MSTDSPSLTGTVFPRLPRRSRTTFRFALVGLVALLTVAAALRLQAPLIGLVSVGMPLLFLAYLYETNAVAAVSRPVLLITSTCGVVLGVGWALGTDAAVARAEDDALGIPVSAARLLLTGLAIPLGFVILLLAPVVLARLRRAEVRQPFDGFAIGSLAAYCFTAAGTLTRLAPQFASGPVADEDRSAAGLVVAVVIQGLALPLVAAAVGGAVGATLWRAQRTDTGRAHRWYSPSSPTPSIVGGVLLFLGLGVIDLAAPSRYVQLGLYALTAVVALFALRIVLKATAVVDTPADAAPPTTRSTPTARLLLVLGAASAVVVAGSVGLSLWLTPPKPHYVCPPDCERPPISKPVATNPRFMPDSGEFSVSYPGEGTAYQATIDSNGVVADLLAGDGGTLRLFGEPAAGRTPRQIADELIQSTYPDATTDYEIPNALVGYQLGYGEVADFYAADSIGDDDRLRILVMVAVKNDFALVAAAAGPYHEFSPDFGSGHPSGANFFLALDMAKYVNSFSWRGDPPR